MAGEIILCGFSKTVHYTASASNILSFGAVFGYEAVFSPFPERIGNPVTKLVECVRLPLDFAKDTDIKRGIFLKSQVHQFHVPISL